jgi:translation initiation factor 3 subunit F
MSEAIYLPDTSALPTVKVHPIAVMGILNSYMRRTDRNARIIGTLMGVAREGNIEILGNIYTLHCI